MFEIVRRILPIAVMALMFAQGLLLDPREQLAFIKRRPLLMVRSLVAVVVLVPLAGYGVITLFEPWRPVGIGLALLAASPAAPFQMMNIVKRGGSRTYLAAMHISLALLALVTVPITIDLFSIALNFRAEITLIGLAKTVGLLLLVPVCVGMLVGQYRPATAAKIGPRIARVAELILYVLLIELLVLTFDSILAMPAWSYLVMAVFIVVNLAIGHVLAPSDPSERTTLAMETGARNFGLALAIGTLNFSEAKALAVLIPYFVVFAVISTIYLRIRAKGTA